MNPVCAFSSLTSPDQTPTPTRFLQNCEEVGLFKEIEEEFLQAQEEEKSKQVHVKTKSNLLVVLQMHRVEGSDDSLLSVCGLSG